MSVYLFPAQLTVECAENGGMGASQENLLVVVQADSAHAAEARVGDYLIHTLPQELELTNARVIVDDITQPQDVVAIGLDTLEFGKAHTDVFTDGAEIAPVCINGIWRWFIKRFRNGAVYQKGNLVNAEAEAKTEQELIPVKPRDEDA